MIPLPFLNAHRQLLPEVSVALFCKVFSAQTGTRPSGHGVWPKARISSLTNGPTKLEIGKGELPGVPLLSNLSCHDLLLHHPTIALWFCRMKETEQNGKLVGPCECEMGFYLMAKIRVRQVRH